MRLSILLRTTSHGGHDATDVSPSAEIADDTYERLLDDGIVSLPRKHAAASILAISAARNCAAADNTPPARLGVITVGGPVHLEVAYKLTKVMIEDGAEFVDPLSFPHSIASSVSASVAAACKARAFAFGLGHDRCAFLDGIHNASRLIRSGCADSVLVVAAHKAGVISDHALREGFNRKSSDVATAALITTHELGSNALHLLSSSTRPASVDEVENHLFDLPKDRIFQYVEHEEQPIAMDACAATGGWLLVKSSWRMFQRNIDERYLPFAVGVIDRRRRSEITVQWRPSR